MEQETDETLKSFIDKASKTPARSETVKSITRKYTLSIQDTRDRQGQEEFNYTTPEIQVEVLTFAHNIPSSAHNGRNKDIGENS